MELNKPVGGVSNNINHHANLVTNGATNDSKKESRMIKLWTLIGLALFLLIGCQRKSADPSNDRLAGAQLYKDAEKKVREMEFDSAIVILSQALTKGIENPMQIVVDSNFFPLIDSPRLRPEMRSLLEEFAVENQANMIRNNEPGEPIEISGKIVEERNNKPLANVKLALVHTDNEGFYFRENTKWNPRIFAYLVTDDNGEFLINTIRPGKYKDDDGYYLPAHVHFTLKKDSFRVYGGEFTFEDDSILIANGNLEQIPVAKLMNANRPKLYQVAIPLQREQRIDE